MSDMIGARVQCGSPPFGVMHHPTAAVAHCSDPSPCPPTSQTPSGSCRLPLGAGGPLSCWKDPQNHQMRRQASAVQRTDWKAGCQTSPWEALRLSNKSRGLFGNQCRVWIGWGVGRDQSHPHLAGDHYTPKRAELCRPFKSWIFVVCCICEKSQKICHTGRIENYLLLLEDPSKKKSPSSLSCFPHFSLQKRETMKKHDSNLYKYIF